MTSPQPPAEPPAWPRIDFDAAGWFVVALIATSFGILPVLTLPMLLGFGRISDVGYLVSEGLLTTTVFGIAAALLVRARPWRRLVDLVATLFALSLGLAVLMAGVRFVAAPGAWGSIIREMAPAATFGLVRFTSAVGPLRLDTPDVARYLGLVLGFAIERALLRRAGKAVGVEAAPRIQPWPLKRPPHAEEPHQP